MTKKVAWVAVIVLIVIGVVVAMSMRRARMMGGGGGAQLELAAVSSEGAQIPPSSEVTAITGELPNNAAAQKAGDLIVSLALNPYPPTVTQPANFDVTLTDVNGQAINDATISLNLTMPEMMMPPNQPNMEFVADGKYHASAYYTMRGWWRIEVIVTRGGATQSVFFDVGL